MAVRSWTNVRFRTSYKDVRADRIHKNKRVYQKFDTLSETVGNFLFAYEFFVAASQDARGEVVAELQVVGRHQDGVAGGGEAVKQTYD